MRHANSLLLATLALALAGCASAPPQVTRPSFPTRAEVDRSDYYSPSGEEVVLEFDGVHQAQLAGPNGTDPVAPGDAQWEVDRLMVYLAGPAGSGAVKAGPKYDGKITVLGYERIGSSPEWRIRYRYRGTFAMGRGHTGTFPVMVPRNVQTIYQRSQVPGNTDAARNPCTNAHLNSEYYFWYFWNPAAAGCPLREGVDYNLYQARVTPIPNRSSSRYPDYPRLPDSTGALRMSLVFGADDDAKGQRAPEANNDYNAPNYVDVARRLTAAGFRQRRLPLAEIAAGCSSLQDATPTIDEFTRQDGTRKVTVRMYWGSTHLGHQSNGFACFLDDGLRNSGVITYSAHSGLGESIFLRTMRAESGLPLHVDPQRYQIFGFHSCSSYGYYNTDFFEAKKTTEDPAGTRNLEVITSGVSTEFEKLARSTWKQIEPVLLWSRTGRWTSYQDILDNMDEGTLTGVSGIRDNPSRPPLP